MSIEYTPISEYQKSSFSAPTSEGHLVKHDIYRRGTGAPVILIQELPGIGKETLRLADRFVDNGFEIIMPHLFGPLEKTNMGANLLRVFCMRKEFRLFEANKSSPIVDWLKALCQSIRDEKQVAGVGVIGMCLTGNFAISLMGDDSVLASVASQPAMPFHKQAALHMNEAEIQATKDRIDKTAPMKAYRFAEDRTSSGEKFQCIHQKFNTDGAHRIDLNTLPGKGHSVFTLDFVDEDGHPTHQALTEILGYFKAQLQPAPASTA